MKWKKAYKPLIALVLITVLPQIVFAQNTPEQLKKHVYILAADSMEGRLTGSAGEQKAAEYIAGYFKEAGLVPAGDSKTYYHSFTFSPEVIFGEKNNLEIAGKVYTRGKDYDIIPYSATAKVKGKLVDVGFGIKDTAKNHNDLEDIGNLKGKVLLVNLGLPGGIHPHSEYLAYQNWRSRLDILLPLKPAAIVFYGSDDPPIGYSAKGLSQINAYEIPLIYLNDSIAKQIKEKQASEKSLQVFLTTDVKKKKVTGQNVVGFVDNNAIQTVVIGAHYDHLGYGEYGGTFHKNEMQIHNGADDNASGTAVLIELARKMASAKNKYNYMFIAFSGEELGLLGSNAFTKKPYFKDHDIVYMLNMDMVGRLDSIDRKLGVNGSGTSSVWDSVIVAANEYAFTVSTTASGLGASDHTSFYLNNIPAIHFFTGLHKDYHKPGDDAHKLNYAGMADVMDYVYRITEIMETLPPPEFTKTVDTAGRSAPRFTVTLGIMPDYFYKGEGLRLEGVSDGKPAAEAGLKEGDIVIRIGMYRVKDIMAYMQALSNFKKGQEVEVEVLREGKSKKFTVNF